MNNIIELLIKIDRKANEKNISDEVYINCGKLILKISNDIIDEYGIYTYLKLLNDVNKKLGHTLSPLDSTLIQKLIVVGCNVKIKSYHQYCVA